MGATVDRASVAVALKKVITAEGLTEQTLDALGFRQGADLQSSNATLMGGSNSNKRDRRRSSTLNVNPTLSVDEFQTKLFETDKRTELISVFKALGAVEADGLGCLLDVTELRRRCTIMGLTTAESDVVVNLFDQDASGEVDLDEFHKVLAVDLGDPRHLVDEKLVSAMWKLIGRGMHSIQDIINAAFLGSSPVGGPPNAKSKRSISRRFSKTVQRVAGIHATGRALTQRDREAEEYRKVMAELEDSDDEAVELRKKFVNKLSVGDHAVFDHVEKKKDKFAGVSSVVARHRQEDQTPKYSVRAFTYRPQPAVPRLAFTGLRRRIPQLVFPTLDTDSEPRTGGRRQHEDHYEQSPDVELPRTSTAGSAPKPRTAPSHSATSADGMKPGSVHGGHQVPLRCSSGLEENVTSVKTVCSEILRGGAPHVEARSHTEASERASQVSAPHPQDDEVERDELFARIALASQGMRARKFVLTSCDKSDSGSSIIKRNVGGDKKSFPEMVASARSSYHQQAIHIHPRPPPVTKPGHEDWGQGPKVEDWLRNRRPPMVKGPTNQSFRYSRKNIEALTSGRRPADQERRTTSTVRPQPPPKTSRQYNLSDDYSSLVASMVQSELRGGEPGRGRTPAASSTPATPS